MGWELPDAFATLRRLMEARMGKPGKREYVQVLRLLETFEMEHVHGAVRHALELGAIGYDADQTSSSAVPDREDGRRGWIMEIYPYLPTSPVVETTRPVSYRSLMPGLSAGQTA